MPSSARVTSIDALRKFRTALVRFEEEAGMALAQADTEAMRTIDWLKGDRLSYWKAEKLRREEKLKSAKSELSRAQTMTSDMSPKSFVDQKKAVERAKRAVQEAAEKQAATRRWIRELSKEYMMYKGRVQPLATDLSARLPAARHTLEQMAQRLDEYTQIESPSSAPGAEGVSGNNAANAGASGGMGMARGVADTDRVRWSHRVPTRPQRQRVPMGALDAVPERWPMSDGSRREGPLLEPEAQQLLQRVIASLDSKDAAARTEPVPSQDKIIVSAGWFEAPRLLLHRHEKPGLGDSGWFIGDADHESPATPMVAVRAGELLAAMPALTPLLSLPRATAALIADGTIREITTDAGRRLDIGMHENDGTDHATQPEDGAS